MKKYDLTQIENLVYDYLKNDIDKPLTKEFALKLENYFRKFSNTRSAQIKSIITDLMEFTYNNVDYNLKSMISTMQTLGSFSKLRISKFKK
tara:strand:+ start:121 stop:393 length:273 start_codon:yes stop_codon:yes gene_type:complete